MQSAFLASLGAVLLAVAASGCQTTTDDVKASSKPTLRLDARPTPRGGLSADEIRMGAKLALNKCVRCHQLYDATAYQEAEWRAWMVMMSRKAHLKPDQEELLLRYFEGFRQP
jgi:hypothetical protein